MINNFIVFTGPSGVGKATIEEGLFNDPELKLRLSVSATTRKPRVNEVDGVHYHFISHEEFDKRIDNEEFIEWNEHFSNKYGTLKSEIVRISNLGFTPFLEVETVGAKNIIDNYKAADFISIFIAPPSLEDLRKRIIGRGTESNDQVNERMSRVEVELEYKKFFQHVVVNDDVNVAIEKVKQIIKKGNE